MTAIEVATLKRTELQAAACRVFGKSAATWTGRATNEELREALTTGTIPERFAISGAPDLAAAIAAAINPLIQTQLDEARVEQMIDAKLGDVASFVEAKLAKRHTVTTFEITRPNGTTVSVGRQHKQFLELLSWIEAGCFPFLIGPAGSFKTSAAAKVAEAMAVPSTWRA